MLGSGFVSVYRVAYVPGMANRWTNTDAPRGDDYDARWAALAQSGKSIHGEADCIEALAQAFGVGQRVLDAGCGTGRVAIELAVRGFEAVGVDADGVMLASARTKAPQLRWVLADLAALGSEFAPETFDSVVLAGNVMIFVDPGTEGTVVANLATLVVPRGLLIAGFQVRSDRLSLERYDQIADAAGLSLVARFATWDREPFLGGDYAVSAHQRSH